MQLRSKLKKYVFERPTLRAIHRLGKNLPKPKLYVKEGIYPQLLERMHHAGMLAWRKDADQRSALAKHVDKLQMTIFAITKRPQKG